MAKDVFFPIFEFCHTLLAYCQIYSVVAVGDKDMTTSEVKRTKVRVVAKPNTFWQKHTNWRITLWDHLSGFVTTHV